MTLNNVMTDMLAAAEARGFLQGQQQARAIDLGEDYGSHYSVVTLISSSKAMLRREVKNRNHRRYGDNPGQAFLWTCDVIRYHKTGNEWIAICLASVHYDV